MNEVTLWMFIEEHYVVYKHSLMAPDIIKLIIILDELIVHFQQEGWLVSWLSGDSIGYDTL